MVMGSDRDGFDPYGRMGRSGDGTFLGEVALIVSRGGVFPYASGSRTLAALIRSHLNI